MSNDRPLRVREAIQIANELGAILIIKEGQIGKYSDLRDLDFLISVCDCKSFVKEYCHLLNVRMECELISFVQNEYSFQLKLQSDFGLLHIDLLPDLTVRGLSVFSLSPMCSLTSDDDVKILHHSTLNCYTNVRNFLLKGEQSEAAWSYVSDGVIARALSRTLPKCKMLFFLCFFLACVNHRGFKVVANVFRHYWLIVTRHLMPPGIVVISDFDMDGIAKNIESLGFFKAVRIVPQLKWSCLRLLRYLYHDQCVVTNAMPLISFFIAGIGVKFSSPDEFIESMKLRAVSRMNSYLGR